MAVILSPRGNEASIMMKRLLLHTPRQQVQCTNYAKYD